MVRVRQVEREGGREPEVAIEQVHTTQEEQCERSVDGPATPAPGEETSQGAERSCDQQEQPDQARQEDAEGHRTTSLARLGMIRRRLLVRQHRHFVWSPPATTPSQDESVRRSASPDSLSAPRRSCCGSPQRSDGRRNKCLERTQCCPTTWNNEHNERRTTAPNHLICSTNPGSTLGCEVSHLEPKRMSKARASADKNEGCVWGRWLWCDG